VPFKKLKQILNKQFPKDISVILVEKADENFHARYSAKERTYGYQMYVCTERNVFLDRFWLPITSELNIPKLREFFDLFVGVKDFKAFCSSDPGQKSTVREIVRFDIVSRKIEIDKRSIQGYEIIITANAFLYHMVRSIIAVLLEYSSGLIEVEQLKDHLAGKEKYKKLAEPNGLFLREVKY
jgi:tRNA pseudouridine38-40 synthase